MKIQELRNLSAQVISDASVVIIIGVRPNKEDSHIWGPIQNTSANLNYIGSKNHFKDWKSENSKLSFVAETFEGGFTQLPNFLTT